MKEKQVISYEQKKKYAKDSEYNVNTYEKKDYVVNLENSLSEFIQKVSVELYKQSRRSNRCSEVRLRRLLCSFRDEIYIPYRDDSLLEIDRGRKFNAEIDERSDD